MATLRTLIGSMNTNTNTEIAGQQSSDPDMVTGLFMDREQAEQAYSSVANRGYAQSEVNVVMSSATKKKHFSDPAVAKIRLAGKAFEGAGMGSAIGGTVGAIAAIVAAVGTSIAIPGIGIVIAGPAAPAIMGAGGLTGGLAGALVGWGIPDELLKRYEAGIKKGGILIGIKPHSREDAAYIRQQWSIEQGGPASRNS